MLPRKTSAMGHSQRLFHGVLQRSGEGFRLVEFLDKSITGIPCCFGVLCSVQDVSAFKARAGNEGYVFGLKAGRDEEGLTFVV